MTRHNRRKPHFAFHGGKWVLYPAMLAGDPVAQAEHSRKAWAYLKRLNRGT